MSGPTPTPMVRRTLPTVAVFRAMATAAEAETWAYAVAQAAGLSTTTAARVIDRMVGSGWATTRWETPRPAGRPPRRLVELTDAGRAGIAEVLADEDGAPTSRPPRRRPDTDQAQEVAS